MTTLTTPPETKYARSGDVHIAYQVFGEGELDVVIVPGFVSHIELIWEHAPAARYLDAIASFARVIMFDRRGSGLSDRVAQAPTLEERMDDVRAVMDAANSERAVLLGISEGVPMSILFAATYPERVRALVSSGGLARTAWADDYPIGTPPEALLESGTELLFPYWGQGAVLDVVAPTQADNADVRAFFGRMERESATPGMMLGLAAMFLEIDVREVAKTVHVPTLLIHKRHDRLVNVRHSRWLAENMPNARLLELEGSDHNPWYEGVEESLSAVKEFLTGTPYTVEPDRVLATVLFTDIEESTRVAAELGDQRWRDVLEAHQRTVREALERFGGREVKTTGDGFLATFDGPARGIRCARQIVESAEPQGIRVRAGLHTGECEVLGDDIGGVAVHIAARVSAKADAGEVLVSRTVKDLVAGSGIEFADRGEHELKGVPDRWQLLAVAG
jgi:class 3 adenylate cyclase